jgi:hydroxyethylthiazole kinase
VEEMVSFAGALVLNIGTLTPERVTAMVKAGNKASALGTPVILDPVGSGATSFRTAAAKQIISDIRVRVIRGNASEILSLRHEDSQTKGVDSVHSVEEATDTGKILANELNTTLAITGPTDLITDGKRIVRASNGHPMMGRITGTGCAATATIGAFSAVDEDPLSATATALAFFGLAGEIASKKAAAPGSFMIGLIDALYTIAPEHLKRACKFEES